MDTGVLVAVIAGVATISAGVGGAVAGPLASHLTGRRLREAQAEHITAQAEQAWQDIYQRLTADLRVELDRVRSLLASASAEAEQLRHRVLELEGRVAQLATTERHLVDELAAARAQVVEKDTIIAGLRQHVASLRQDLDRALGRTPDAGPVTAG